MTVQKNLGLLLAGIWFLVTGLAHLLSLSFSGMGVLLALLAVAAGVCLLIGR